MYYTKRKRVVKLPDREIDFGVWKLTDFIMPDSYASQAVFAEAWGRLSRFFAENPSYASKLERMIGLDNMVVKEMWNVVNTRIAYRRDDPMFQTPDFWMLPNEVWTQKKGDCEDSLLGSEKVFVRINGVRYYVTLEELFEMVNGTRMKVKDREILIPSDDVEVVSVTVNRNGNITLPSARALWKRVKAIIRHRVRKKLATIKTSGGLRISVTEDHSVFGALSASNLAKPVKPLEARHVLTLYKVPETLSINMQSAPVDTWLPYNDGDVMALLGLWLADGCYDSEHGAVISSGNNIDIIRFVESVVNKIPVGKYGARKKNTPNIYVNKKGDIFILSRKLMNEMKRLGFNGNAYTKRVPEWIYSLDRYRIASLLRGYFSGDGSAYMVKSHRYSSGVAANTVNKDLAYDISALLDVVGIKHTITEQTSITGLGKETRMYIITIHGKNNLEKFMREIGFIQTYKNVKLFKVIELLENSKGYDNMLSLRKVKEVDVDKIDDYVYDLSVEDTENFVANKIVCHNTTFMLESAIRGFSREAEAYAVLGFYVDPYSRKPYGHAWVLYKAGFYPRWLWLETTLETVVPQNIWYVWDPDTLVPVYWFSEREAHRVDRDFEMLGLTGEYVRKHNYLIRAMIDYVEEGVRLNYKFMHKGIRTPKMPEKIVLAGKCLRCKR